MANVARLVENDVNALVVMPAAYDANAVTMADCSQDSQLTVCGVNESTVIDLAKALGAGDVISTDAGDAVLGYDDIDELTERLSRRGLRLIDGHRGLEVQS